MKLTREISLFR